MRNTILGGLIVGLILLFVEYQGKTVFMALGGSYSKQMSVGDIWHILGGQVLIYYETAADDYKFGGGNCMTVKSQDTPKVNNCFEVGERFEFSFKKKIFFGYDEL